MNLDQKYFKNNFLVGCDEVGRGPLAGPVVAAAVLATNRGAIDLLSQYSVNDSKKLTSKKRIKILSQLEIDYKKLALSRVNKISNGLYFCIVSIPPLEIEKINILQASLKAMKMATECLALGREQGDILIDGNRAFESIHNTHCLVKGDSKSILIGLASIIAKEFRDEKMKEYDHIYPHYGFATHAGYPTLFHREAIAKFGVTEIHRKTFKGVKEFI